MPVPCCVLAVDVGSVQNRRFAWTASNLPDHQMASSGSKPEEAAQWLAAALGKGPTALGFESPLSVPVPDPTIADSGDELGKARNGDGSRAWSATAGSGALTTGLAQLAWLLGRLRTLDGQVEVTTSPEVWADDPTKLFVWEAFVSGTGKPPVGMISQHASDAEAALATFEERHREDRLSVSDVHVGPHGALNLVWAAARQAGVGVSDSEVGTVPPVYRTLAPAALLPTVVPTPLLVPGQRT